MKTINAFKNIFFINLAFISLIALNKTVFASNNETSEGIPVYLSITDPSEKFDVKIIKNDKCANFKHENIRGLKFLGCADNTTGFALFYEGKNIAQGASVGGFTFPLWGYELPEMSMNRFCGRKITEKYNTWMSIKKGPTEKDSWVINLKIENKKK